MQGNVLWGKLPTTINIDLEANVVRITDNIISFSGVIMKDVAGTGTAIWDLGDNYLVNTISTHLGSLISSYNAADLVKLDYSLNGIAYTNIWTYQNQSITNLTRQDDINTTIRYLKITLILTVDGSGESTYLAAKELQAWVTFHEYVTVDTTDKDEQDSWQVQMFDRKINPFRKQL